MHRGISGSVPLQFFPGTRDPKRINIILKHLKEIWIKYPDLRLGQLISNIAPPQASIFYLEDDIMLKRLKEYKKHLKSLNKT
jgi:uncharacterized protein YihD (DUF1040 family)